jgi:4'-phosphopantetheinyl transferase
LFWLFSLCGIPARTENGTFGRVKVKLFWNYKRHFFFFSTNEVVWFLLFFYQFCRMPLFNTKEVGKRAKLGIWSITEPLDELLKMKKFSQEDISVMESFSHEHRKKEWLAARILIEKLTGQENIQVVYDEHNKPRLKGSKMHISLSHSHGYLAVILDETETGIDIELIKPKIERIKHKFMSDAELNFIRQENNSAQLTVCWCVKESLYKLYGKQELAFKENIFIEPFLFSEKGIIKSWIKNTAMNSRFTLQYEQLNSGSDPYMLAYVIDQV